MLSDLKSTRLNASGEVFGGPSRVVALTWVASGTAGTIEIKDGGSSGTVLTTIDTPASTAASGDLTLPGHGVRHATDIYVTLTNVSFATVFYG